MSVRISWSSLIRSWRSQLPKLLFRLPLLNHPDVPIASPRFITRGQLSAASEPSNLALFLSELCDFLDLPRPDPSQADEALNTYVIDKAV
jgi:hypothetical protein